VAEDISRKIAEADFLFQNSLVRVVANRSSPEIKLVGLAVGPFEEGNQYEIQFWVAEELEKPGIVFFREGQLLDLAQIIKIETRQRPLPASQIYKLPYQFFYPKMRRYLLKLRTEAPKTPEKMSEYKKARDWCQDIVNHRLKKIITLASTPSQMGQILLDDLASEERLLYEILHKCIREWATKIFDSEEETAGEDRI